MNIFFRLGRRDIQRIQLHDKIYSLEKMEEYFDFLTAMSDIVPVNGKTKIQDFVTENRRLFLQSEHEPAQDTYFVTYCVASKPEQLWFLAFLIGEMSDFDTLITKLVRQPNDLWRVDGFWYQEKYWICGLDGFVDARGRLTLVTGCDGYSGNHDGRHIRWAKGQSTNGLIDFTETGHATYHAGRSVWKINAINEDNILLGDQAFTSTLSLHTGEIKGLKS
jgi:hypothetical protein